MIQGTIIKNGTLRLVLTGSDGVDEEVLKQLDGATVKFVSDNLKLFDRNVSGGLILEILLNKSDGGRKEKYSEGAKEVVPNPKT